MGALVRGSTTLIPGGDDIIEPGDLVYVFAAKKSIAKLEKLMAVKFEFF